MKTSYFCSIKLLVLILFIPVLSFANDSVDGKWEGFIELPGMNLNVKINLTTIDDDSLSGTIDIPQQQANQVPLTKLNLDENTIQFTISGVPGDPTFNGEIDGNIISGMFTQGGSSFPFTLERESDEKADAKRLELNEFLDSLKVDVTEALEYWNIPGAAIAIVKDGEIVLSEGFGYRNYEEKLPVHTSTLFAIGSTSKAFTALGVSILEEEGFLEWNEPVISYLPDFRMHDDYATLRLNAIDMLSHRSGLPRHDLAWYGSDRSRNELYTAIQYLEPSFDLRTQFQYQNLMYMLAGVLIEKKSGKTWEDFTRDRIFKPLNMMHSNFSVNELENHENASLAYLYQNEEITHIPYRNIDAMGPAGSINSSVDDMAQWLLFLNNEGKIGEEELVSPTTISKLFEPQTPLTVSTGDIKSSSYGLGWFIDVYRGKLIYQHAGGIDGFITMVGLYPESNAGIVVLTNNMSNALGTLMLRTVADYFHDLEPIDWKARLMPPKSEEEAKAEADEEKTDDTDDGQSDRVKGTQPSLTLQSYSGIYEHGGYGQLQVKFENSTLTASLNTIPITLEHWHFDVFEGTINLGSESKLKIQFQLDSGGSVKSALIPLETTLSPIEFKRKPAETLSSQSYLSSFTGTYSLGPQSVRVSLSGGKLRVTISGQPTYTLVPVSENLFSLENMDGFRLRFELNDDNYATKAIFLQPNGTFEAIRKDN